MNVFRKLKVLSDLNCSKRRTTKPSLDKKIHIINGRERKKVGLLIRRNSRLGIWANAKLIAIDKESNWSDFAWQMNNPGSFTSRIHHFMLNHPPYLSDVAGHDFDLIEKLKSQLKRAKFLSTELVKGKATVILINLA